MADPKTEKPKDSKDAAKQLPPKEQEKDGVPVAIAKDIDELMRRLRSLEERYSGLRKKTQFSEQNMLKDSKDIYEDINVLNSTLSELKSEISELNEKLLKLTEEISTSVKKAEFNVLSKYLDFWQPLNFLTREEAEKIISERFSERISDETSRENKYNSP